MKIVAALILFLCLPATLFAQMTPQYSAYLSLSGNATTNTAYSTVTVQGTTNPYSQNCYYHCYYGTCQIPNCPSTHTPQILNQYGTIGGWKSGPGLPPDAVMNYATTIAFPVAQGTNGTATGQVQCNGCSCLLSVFNWNFGLAYTKSKWKGTDIQYPDGSISCDMSDWCTPATSPPKCSVATVLQDPLVIGTKATCSPYYTTKWFWEQPTGGFVLCFPLFPGQNGTGTTDPSLGSCTK